MLRKGEVDQNVAAGCLEHASGGSSVAEVDARRDFWIAGQHRPTQPLRRTEVHQLRRRDLVVPFADNHRRRWRVILRRSVKKCLLNALTMNLPKDDASLGDEVAVARA